MGDGDEASRRPLKRAGEIYARLNPCAPGEKPVEGKDLSPTQLESVTKELSEELGNMDQTPAQHEMPVETTLERRVRRTLVSASEVRVLEVCLIINLLRLHVAVFWVCVVCFFACVCIFPRLKFTAVPGIDFSSSEICCCIAPPVSYLFN